MFSFLNKFKKHKEQPFEFCEHDLIIIDENDSFDFNSVDVDTYIVRKLYCTKCNQILSDNNSFSDFKYKARKAEYLK